MRLRTVGSMLLAALMVVPACGSSASEDPEFEADWVEDFEGDVQEDAAEEAEQAELDTLDDEDDVEVLDDEGTSESALQAKTLSPKKAAPKRPAHGPISILQDDGWLTDDTRMYEARSIGAKVIRIMVWWAQLAPSPKSQQKPKGFVASKPDDYDFSKLDAQIEAARNNGLKVMLTLTAGNMPYWASEDPGECQKRIDSGKAWSCSYKPSPKEYAKFVTAVGRHVKSKSYRIWGWTFVNEPNIGSFLADEDSPADKDSNSAMEVAFRYRRLWFAARKHLRATAKVKARVFFADMANNQKSPGETLTPASPRWNLIPWSLCLKTEWNPELLDGKYKCPERPRKVHVQGVAFHPYASSPSAALYSVSFLKNLIDDAAATGRIGGTRGIYLTEMGFLTGKGSRSLGAEGAVTPAQQALYLNQTEHVLADDPRIKAVAQYELVDEGRGTWDCGLRFAFGEVHKTDGSVLSGDFLEYIPGSHVTVRASGGDPVRVDWLSIAAAFRTGEGAEKPAYAAYRIALDAEKIGDKVNLWGHARFDTGAGFTVEGWFPGSSSWLEVGVVKTDAYGYGSTTLDVGTATAWRLRFGLDTSRVSNGDEPPPENYEAPDGPEASDPIAADGSPDLRPGCTAKATLGGVPAWFFFTRPDKPCDGKNGVDKHAIKELIRLIESVPKGGRIDGHSFNLTVDSVAKALVEAEDRGVDVWLSTDGQIGKSKDTAKTRWLERLKHVTYCGAANNTACIGVAEHAISHTKLFVFSEAKAPDGAKSSNVVWLGSANQTATSGMKLYNNTVTMYGDATLYGKLRGYLDDLYQQKKTGDYYDAASGRGYLLATAADVFVSPEVETDIVVDRLKDITAGDDCSVRVIQMEILDNRMPVVDQLVALKTGKCDVQIVTHEIGPKALAKLKAAGIPVRRKPIHDKSFIVHARYAGEPIYRVYTGSHNMSNAAVHKSDEIFVRLAPEPATDHPAWDAYVAHFKDAFDDATPF